MGSMTRRTRRNIKRLLGTKEMPPPITSYQAISDERARREGPNPELVPR